MNTNDDTITLYIKEKFNIDLNKYSPEERKIVLEELEEKIDEMLKTEMAKTEMLSAKIKEEQEKITELLTDINNN